MNKVVDALTEHTKSKDYTINDLACTLLIFVATPQWVAAMQIGDGFIVVNPQNSEDYQLLFKPDKGEFVNETTFVTSKNALDEMRVKVLTESPEFICASTDGLERLAIRTSDWSPFPPFFNPLKQYMEETENPEADKDEYLKQFLSSERLNARTDDDKTLLLCLWNKSEKS